MKCYFATILFVSVFKPLTNNDRYNIKGLLDHRLDYKSGYHPTAPPTCTQTSASYKVPSLLRTIQTSELTTLIYRDQVTCNSRNTWYADLQSPYPIYQSGLTCRIPLKFQLSSAMAIIDIVKQYCYSYTYMYVCTASNSDLPQCCHVHDTLLQYSGICKQHDKN